MAACLAPEQPSVLTSEGDAVEQGNVVEPVPGEELPIAVEEVDADALATGETTEDGDADTPATDETAEEGLAAEIGFTDVLVSANYFVNREVENLAGDVIADVDDLLVDLETGQILYVIVNYGGFLDLTDEDRPLPLSAFGWNQELELVLKLSEDQLAGVPAVEDEWPAPGDVAWNDAINPFWQESGLTLEFSAEAVPVRVTELIGLHAGQVGADLGVVEDLLLDLNTQRVAYLGIFTTDSFYSPDLVLLTPFPSADLTLTVAGDDPLYGITLLEVDPEVLRAAPALERSIFSTVSFIDQTFTQELNAYWNEQGFE
jgi:sporulation protein YlmC with PRC-barrel domain